MARTPFEEGYQNARGNQKNFRDRTIIALSKVCASVSAEDQSTLDVPNGYQKPTPASSPAEMQNQLHLDRQELVCKIRLEPERWGGLFAYAIASDPGDAGVGSDSDDAALEFTVSSIFNSFLEHA